jgi:hypothetical protein
VSAPRPSNSNSAKERALSFMQTPHSKRSALQGAGSAKKMRSDSLHSGSECSANPPAKFRPLREWSALGQAAHFCHGARFAPAPSIFRVSGGGSVTELMPPLREALVSPDTLCSEDAPLAGESHCV